MLTVQKYLKLKVILCVKLPPLQWSAHGTMGPLTVLYLWGSFPSPPLDHESLEGRTGLHLCSTMSVRLVPGT